VAGEPYAAEVVVVGAGPVGLWLAGELALAGVDVLVLERLAERTANSKALGIHPRTVEVLAMRDVVEEFLASGMPIPSWHFAMLPSRLDFGGLDTPYPFMLSCPQVRTEELLEERAAGLGVRIEREHAVTGLTQDDDGVRLEGTHSAGHFTARAGWVVGCDGAGSTVRRAAGIGFPGTPGDTVWIMGEVQLDAPPPGAGYMGHGRHGAIIVIPTPGRRYRVSTPRVDQNAQGVPDLDELKAAAALIAGTDYGMHSPSWLADFNDAARLADTYRRGRVLLAGDAAHKHFPAGGVGLNTGLQEAMNLGWKLAAVVQGRAGDELLDTYHDERHPLGQDLMRSVLAQTELIHTTTEEGIALRALLSDQIAAVPELALSLARKVTALDVAYPAVDGAHPLTGQRMPAPHPVSAAPGFELLRRGRPVLLVRPEWMPGAAAQLERSHGIISHSSPLLGSIRPGWGSAAAVLVRPDGHVWWAIDANDGVGGLGGVGRVDGVGEGGGDGERGLDAAILTAVESTGVRFGR
jgi:2-polyprenyl-6-methoxyphenol hydroxylase-like FAD-dependent oxidoreductase